LRILCIDDNVEITTLLDRVLKAKGFNFVSCNDGKEGLKLIQTGDFDLILLDVAMPYFSGRDVINELKKEKSIDNYNIVLFTASVISDVELDAFFKEGVKECIKKPVRIEDLLTMIKKFVK
jgi:two-component system OmpR family response regulator